MNNCYSLLSSNLKKRNKNTTLLLIIRVFGLLSSSLLLYLQRSESEKSSMADHIWKKKKGNRLPLWDDVKIID